MSLAPGTKLGAYEILSVLGTGGMGEVYRAKDSRLDRVVALKVLPQGLAADPKQHARFEREAKAVAALNHPNIVTIHSIENAGDIEFITMELVAGQTLGALMPRHGWALEKLLAIAIPLADAVSAAHKGGITHRDLKPSNVMLTPDGQVKVLDFGLAKALAPGGATANAEGTETQLVAEALTDKHTIVGTVAYMSPEQAEGRAVDERSDIFSLGVLLYEMATGARPFKGDTSVSILSSILKDTPKPVSEENPALPRDFARIVRRCLAKEPDRRYQNAKDFRNDLDELRADLSSGELARPSAAAAPRRGGSPLPWIVVGAVVIAAVAAVIIMGRSRSGGAAAIEATFSQVTSQSGAESNPSISPDGRWIVYDAGAPDGRFHIYLQSVGGQTPIDLTKDASPGDAQPAFSPDGEQIAFRSERQGGGVFVMARTGELARKVSDAGYNPAWSPDGKSIVYSTVRVNDPYNRPGIGSLVVVDLGTGAKRQLGNVDASRPSWSPHGTRIAFYAAATGQRDIFTMPSGGGDPVPVTNDIDVDVDPVWSPDGKYLYFSSDRGGSLNLWRVPIDEATGRTTGPLEAVTTPSGFVSALTISADGRRLAFAATANTSNLQRFAVDPAAGRVLDSGTWITTGSVGRVQADVAPDGGHVVYHTVPVREDMFVSAIDGTGVQPLTTDRARNRIPRWSPDGKQIAFYSNRGGSYEIWAMNADGSGVRQLTAAGTNMAYPVWSPDGSRMVATSLDKDETYIFDPRVAWTAQQPERLPPSPFGRLRITDWSADQRWIAADANVTGTGIVLYDVTAKTYQKIGNDPAQLGPRWLGANQMLTLWRGRIMLLNLTTKSSKEFLTVAPDFVRGFNVTLDGRTLLITRGSNEADIWLATIK